MMEDYALVQEYIYLPLARRVLEQDYRKLEKAGLKFSELYLSLIERKMQEIGKEIARVKREVKKRGIVVHKHGKEGVMMRYLIVQGGKEREMRIYSHVMANTVRDILDSYINK